MRRQIDQLREESLRALLDKYCDGWSGVDIGRMRAVLATEGRLLACFDKIVKEDLFELRPPSTVTDFDAKVVWVAKRVLFRIRHAFRGHPVSRNNH